MPVEAILITWQETTGTTPTADLIQETLAPYDLNTVLTLLAQIAGMRKTWQNNPDNESDKELINELLPTHRQRITAFRTNKHVAFSRPGILATAQHACTACKHRNQAPTPPTPQDIERILTCCIMAHDLLIKRQPTPNDTTVEKASTLLPLANYIPHNTFPRDLVRNLILLEDIAPTLQDRNDYIDLIRRFTSATGLPPRDFIALAYTASIQHLTTKRSTLRPFILTPNYLAHESIPPSHVTAFLEHASITTQALSNESYAHPTTTPDFLSFQRHPLIEVQPGGYVTIDPGFLLDKAGRSLYWTLHDATPPADRHHLLTYWSMLIERYIHWLAKTTYHGKGTLHLAPQFGNGDEASDLLITEGTSLIIMEVKASILTVAAKSGTRPEILQAELHRKAITGEDGERKGVAQLHHTLTRWLDGDDITGITRSTIKTIYPALVFWTTRSPGHTCTSFITNTLIETASAVRPSVRSPRLWRSPSMTWRIACRTRTSTASRRCLTRILSTTEAVRLSTGNSGSRFLTRSNQAGTSCASA
jgi:hypothetical protein